MEIFAQWLDDVDDLIFALALYAERARVRCLRTALVASLLLATAVFAELPAAWASTSSYIAGANICAWLFGLLLSGLHPESEPRSA